jgi:uncharacterized protein (TIGR02594 family)
MVNLFYKIKLWFVSLFKKKDLRVTLPDDMPEWLRIAKKEIGVIETTNGDNPRILQYHLVTKLKAKTEDTPWCAAFVCWCLEQAGIVSTRSAWAKDFLNWGVEIDKPRVGCIVVFSRGNVGGHAGFYVSETKTHIMILGGNQSNMVNMSEYSKSNLLGFRWPV